MTDTSFLERTVTHRLHALSKITDRLTQLAFTEELGLAISTGRCIGVIGAFGPISVKNLAAKVNLTKGQASREAQSLVDKGIVHKADSPTDGRGVQLFLTSEGERIWQRLMTVVERRNAEIVSGLDAAEVLQFNHVLDLLLLHAHRAADLNSKGNASPTGEASIWPSLVF